MLRPGRNVWRVETAARAAVLTDAAAFSAAVRGACLKARRSILAVGWDIDSRARLVGEDGQAADGHASAFARFLGEIASERPELQVHLLLRDDSLPYAGERAELPHQGILVIDDAVAFCGSLDLTIRGWPRPAPAPHDHRGADPWGKPHRPVHDVQMMVDGPAARALALLARERWSRATGSEAVVTPVGDPWPDAVAPDFTDVAVGIARTQPCVDDEEPVREAETLFLDAIDVAEREIYIETRFPTSMIVADRLAARLARLPDLQVVIVAPRSHDPWGEPRPLRNDRIRSWHRVAAAGGDRVRLMYPGVEQPGHACEATMHSKVMIVDDRFLRVGSANPDNRSMGVATECDVAIDARTGGERAAIQSVRDRLLGNHCGVPADTVASSRRAGAQLF